MINQSTIDALREMRLTAMATELELQLADQVTYGSLGFEERLGLIVDAESNRRKSNELKRFIRNARFLSIPDQIVPPVRHNDTAIPLY